MVKGNYFSEREVLCKKHVEMFINTLGVSTDKKMLLEYAISKIIDDGYQLCSELNADDSSKKRVKKENV